MLMQTVSVFAGVDWGTVVHRVCVLNAAGQVVCSRAIEYNGKAIADFLRSVMELAEGDSGRVAVAIEVHAVRWWKRVSTVDSPYSRSIRSN